LCDHLKNSERFHLNLSWVSPWTLFALFWVSWFSDRLFVHCDLWARTEFLEFLQFQKWSNSLTIFFQCRLQLHQKLFEQNKLLKSDYELMQGFIKIGQFDKLASAYSDAGIQK
jgi:hypothetical protein